MFRCLLVCVLLLCAAPLRGQATVAGATVFGKVQDAQARTSLPFLTVQLLADKDSAFVSGRLTNEEGAFTFAGLKRGV
jgi:hypothetical protein